MTFEERAARLTAMDDCERLISKHCYYHSMGWRREEFDRLWSKRNDITLSLNSGKLCSRASIYKSYVLDQEQESFDYHMQVRMIYPQIDDRVKDFRTMLRYRKPLSSNMVIEVAEDGKSAKGLWYAMGYEMNTLNLTKKIQARWLMQRYGADFIFEDGEWRILNLSIFSDAEGRFDEYQWPINKTESCMEKVNLDTREDLHMTHSKFQLPQATPAIPQPYKTLD